MAKKRRKISSRRRRGGLVYNHLESVSRELLEQHPDIVKQFIGKNPGVYALYRRDELYYVGLTVGLRHRLKAHLKNRHGDSWDRFSIYLTNDQKHLREIEALALRIAKPSGAKQRGKLAQSRDMRSWMAREIRVQQRRRVDDLFNRERVAKDTAKNGEGKTIGRLFPRGAKLRGTLKGKHYLARIRRDGRIRFAGAFYKSLSKAAAAALNRPTNGWWFWEVKRGGIWVRVREIRRAGIPFYAR